jgi:hypothetical protein
MSLARISLEEFAVDPQLGNFAEASTGQRLVMRLLDGLPPRDQDQAELLEAIAGRPWGEDLSAPRRTVAAIMGADSGKSLIAAQFLTHRALFADLSALRAGQRGTGLLIAPDTRLASIPLAYIRGLLTTSPLIASEVERETADSILFCRGTEILVLPATLGGRAVRGRRYVAAVPEECAFFRDANSVVNDVEIVRAVMPRLLPGAQLFAISTPWRRAGWLYELHRREFGQQKRALVLQAPTVLMRPDKAAAEIQEQYDADPAMAAVELGAEFAENTAGLLEPADVDAVTAMGVQRRAAAGEGWRYLAATDPSGLRNDPWAFTIVGTCAGAVVQFVVRSWRPGTAVERVIEEIGAELAAFNLRRVVSDGYSSEIAKAHFVRAGLHLEEAPFTGSASSPKLLGFKALKELVLARRITLLDDPEQRRELMTLEVTRLAGGGERIAAPGRLHDDRACALALALHELRPGRGANTIGGGELTEEEIEDGGGESVHGLLRAQF